jgi:hypothetical protein
MLEQKAMQVVLLFANDIISTKQKDSLQSFSIHTVDGSMVAKSCTYLKIGIPMKHTETL